MFFSTFCGGNCHKVDFSHWQSDFSDDFHLYVIYFTPSSNPGLSGCFVYLILKRDTLHFSLNLCMQLRENLLDGGKYVEINFVSYTRSILCGGILKSHKFTRWLFQREEYFCLVSATINFQLKYLTEDKTENRLERDT